MMRKFLAAAAIIGLLASPALAETDCSGTIIAGNTAQPAWAAGGQTRWFIIMNNSANLMCMSMTGTATFGGTNCAPGSYPLQPGSATAAGGSYASLQLQQPNTVSIISSTTGDRYSCTRSN